MRVVASALGVHFIPLFDRFKQEMEKGREFLPDGLHPNDEGHAFIGELLIKELGPLLS